MTVPHAHPTADETPTGAAGPGRYRALLEAVSRLPRPRRARFPLASALLTFGSILVPVGFVFIILGWYGAAHTLNVYEQNSYLMSGGILGSCLVLVGCFSYFGYWMTRHLELTRQALMQGPVAASRPGPDDAPAPATPELVATRRGTLVHRSGCQVVARKADLRIVEPGRGGFRPCQICNPLG